MMAASRDQQPATVRIRRITEADWPAAWAIIEPVFRAGETYVMCKALAP